MLSVLCWISLVITDSSGQIVREQHQIGVKVLQGGNEQCPSMERRERARNEISQSITSILIAEVQPNYESITLLPKTDTSTTALPKTNPTYTCNGMPGWRHVTFINMTNTSYSCPTGLNITSYSKRTCGRSHRNPGCSSTTFTVGGTQYSQVCGRMRGYQFGGTVAFSRSIQGIDGYYVDGISLTHGGIGMRQHIWTFAAGLSEVSSRFLCPCNTLGNVNLSSYTMISKFPMFTEKREHAWPFLSENGLGTRLASTLAGLCQVADVRFIN